MTSHWPERWRPTRLKYESSLKGRLGWQGLKAEEYRDEGPYVVSSAHFENMKVRWELCPRVSLERYLLDENIQLAPHDILLMKDGAALGKLAYVDQLLGLACLNSHLLLLRPLESSYDPRYLFYVATTGMFQDYMKVYGTGSTFMGVSQRDIGNFQFSVPPLEEQTQIAKFLDYETAKIDALIAKQQQLIALLQEKRQAVISHAVTKGLNPAAPLRDSGVEWLGQVPAHWCVGQMKRWIREMEQGKSVECESRPAEGTEWGVLKTGCVNGGIYTEQENKALPSHISPEVRYEVKAGDVLMSRASGSTDLIGSVAFVHTTRSRILLSDKIFRFHFEADLDSHYFTNLMASSYMRTSIVRNISGAEGMANNITKTTVLGFPIPVPPIDEQRLIAASIQKASDRISDLMHSASLMLDVLAERRTALIAAAVTGKIDVRGWQPPPAAAEDSTIEP